MGPSRGGGPSLVLTLKARLSKLVTRATFPFQLSRKGKKKKSILVLMYIVCVLCKSIKEKRKRDKWNVLQPLSTSFSVEEKKGLQCKNKDPGTAHPKPFVTLA